MSRARSYHRLDPVATNGDLELQDLPRLLPGMTRLAQALLRTRAHRQDPQHAALTASALAPLGLTLTDLRQLLSEGLVAMLPLPLGEGRGEGGPKARRAGNRTNGRAVNARKVAGASTKGVGGQASGLGKTGNERKVAGTVPVPLARNGAGKNGNINPPKLTRRTLLLLTDAGLAYITKESRLIEPSPSFVTGSLREPSAQQPSPSGKLQGDGALNATGLGAGLPTAPRSALLPSYDIDNRELSVAGVVILRLAVQARNLAAVLTTLELSGWKARLPKPLNGSRGGNEPAHLADAVYSLNLHQTVIDFHADGGAIRWEWREASNPARRTSLNGSPRVAQQPRSPSSHREDREKTD